MANKKKNIHSRCFSFLSIERGGCLSHSLPRVHKKLGLPLKGTRRDQFYYNSDRESVEKLILVVGRGYSCITPSLTFWSEGPPPLHIVLFCHCYGSIFDPMVTNDLHTSPVRWAVVASKIPYDIWIWGCQIQVRHLNLCTMEGICRWLPSAAAMTHPLQLPLMSQKCALLWSLPGGNHRNPLDSEAESATSARVLVFPSEFQVILPFEIQGPSTSNSHTYWNQLAPNKKRV